MTPFFFTKDPQVSNTPITGNVDAPVASVAGKYISEITSVIALIAALLVIFIGKDFGVAKHAQDLMPLVLAVVPAFMSLSRAFKHSSAVIANAQVYAAQTAAVVTSATLKVVPVSVVDVPVVVPDPVVADASAPAVVLLPNDGGIPSP